VKRTYKLLLVAAIVVLLSGVGYFAYGYADIDGDGLTNNEEKRYHTDSSVADTDRDGLKDGEEVNVYRTDPTESDTSGDERHIRRRNSRWRGGKARIES